MSLLLRGAAGLALSALVVAGLAPAVQADNLEADSLVGGVASLGNVCRGASATGSVGFALRRTGNTNQSWASSATVTVSPGPHPESLTLGSTSATTPSTWQAATTTNNTLVDAGNASVGLDVPAGAALGAQSATVVYSASGAGAGGGTTTRTAPVTITWNVIDCTPADTTAPVITKVLTPATPDGANGWYRSDVSVDWTVTDAESEVTLDGCQDAALTSDGSLTSTCSAASKGGIAGPVSVTVERDATPPSLEPVVTGELGEDGWYVGDVVVSWNATDATSGIDPATQCAPSTLADDTTSRTFSCTVSDLAGNTALAEVTLKRDATDPVVVSQISGAIGGDGWYTSDVEVSFDVSDATSALASTSGCEDVTVDQDTDGESYTCTAIDGAGNTSSSTVDVKRDATAPEVTYSRSGFEGNDGWYRGPVLVTWNVTDTGSGVAQGCDPETVNGDGSHAPECTATDVAGNSVTNEALVDVDATAPVITPTVTGPDKGTEWFTGDVAVSWSVSDETSGVSSQSGCDAVTVAEDTTGTTYTCSALDVAGNDASRSVTVKRDATAPALTLTGGPTNGATYDFGDVPAASTCTASDDTSGLVGGCQVTAGLGTVGTGRTQVATATDRAGNVARDERTYAVAAWKLDGFYRPVVMGEGVVNTVKAGSTVPLKFNVTKGTAPMTAGIGARFTTTKTGCDGGDVEDPIELVTTGGTSLRYDATGGQWIQNWATPAAGKNTCYRVTMTTADGSSIAADFKLK